MEKKYFIKVKTGEFSALISGQAKRLYRVVLQEEQQGSADFFEIDENDLCKYLGYENIEILYESLDEVIEELKKISMIISYTYEKPKYTFKIDRELAKL